MQNDKPTDYLFELSKVLGIINYRGRIVECKPDGTYIMKGLKFNSVEELDKAIDIAMQNFIIGIK